jgi:CRP/FNR family transcriptional regulator, cyclic AMP receptor protein
MTAIVDALADVPLFADLPEDDLASLAKHCRELTFAAQQVLFREGDPGESMFIVRTGSIVVQHQQGTQIVTLATFSPGQVLGEMSLFDDSVRSATATAAIPSTVWMIAQSELLTFLRERPHAALTLMAEMAQRLRQMNELFANHVSRDVLEDHEEDRPLGARVADRVASFGGSWAFIGVFVAIMAVWMAINLWLGDREGFDPYPFILLNLALSSTAALQAPIIMMSQNRQSQKDKLLAQNDYRVNLKTELGVEQLLRQQAALLARVATVESMVAPQPSSKGPL